jgi:hypothetical protein
MFLDIGLQNNWSPISGPYRMLRKDFGLGKTFLFYGRHEGASHHQSSGRPGAWSRRVTSVDKLIV